MLLPLKYLLFYAAADSDTYYIKFLSMSSQKYLSTYLPNWQLNLFFHLALLLGGSSDSYVPIYLPTYVVVKLIFTFSSVAQFKAQFLFLFIDERGTIRRWRSTRPTVKELVEVREGRSLLVL